jgi:hypothetical protein
MENNVDYLCLGQTIPENSKKYGLRVCTAGLDIKTNSLIRIYPLGVRKEQHFRRWDVYKDLPVRKNNNDNRIESWRLNIDIDRLPEIPAVKSKTRAELVAEYFQQYGSTGVKKLNEERRSLAIVRLNDMQPYFVDHSKTPINVRQLCLFDDTDDQNTFSKIGFSAIPRVKWIDDDGDEHDYMFNSWDAYMHQKKIAPIYGKDSLWKNVKRQEPKYALIGNMNHQRNTWLIITIFNL